MKCEYFLLCENDAVGLTAHPAFPAGVPTCERCRAKFDLTYEELLDTVPRDRDGTATLTYRNGRKKVLTIHAEFSDGSFWATPGRNANTGYSLEADGSVYRLRHGSGRNAGEVLSSTPVDATYEVA